MSARSGIINLTEAYIKVLLINGSPHKSGCTYIALSEAANILNAEGIETEIVWIGNKPISGCIACRACVKLRKCVIDDIVNEVRPKCYEADGFIFGSPVHFGAITGDMTSFMDRLLYSELRGNDNAAFYLKPTAAVISTRRAGATAAVEQMMNYFLLRQMPVITTRYWPIVHGTTPDEVMQDLEGVHSVRTMAKNMALFLKCKQAGIAAGVKPPELEPHPLTNFIR